MKTFLSIIIFLSFFGTTFAQGQNVVENSQTVLNDMVDFCKVAEGLGCMAIRVTAKEEVAPAFEKALAAGRPVVIECMIPEDDKVFPMVPAGAPISEAFDGDDLAKKEAN